MEFQDKTLNCVDCGDPFIWTAGEQLFFADKNFKNEPKRCKSCKAKRAARPSGAAALAASASKPTTNCRPATRKRRCRSARLKGDPCSVASASSRGNSRGPADLE
jgi:hypothetical protein